MHRHTATGYLIWGQCNILNYSGLKRRPGQADQVGVMPYIIRDDRGQIVGLADNRPDERAEELLLSDPEVQTFLRAARAQLSSSDTETIRVIEDLIDVLIQKKLILLTDLPVAAQQKLSERQRMRSELNALDNLMVGEDDIL
jgi:hypothetical protein